MSYRDVLGPNPRRNRYDGMDESPPIPTKIRKNYNNSFSNLSPSNVRSTTPTQKRQGIHGSDSPGYRKIPSTSVQGTIFDTPTRGGIVCDNIVQEDRDEIPDFSSDSDDKQPKQPTTVKNAKTIADLEKKLDDEREKNKILEQDVLKLQRENVILKRCSEKFEKENAELSPTAEENRKIRNFLIANIQLGNNAANESENMQKIDIMALFNRFTKTFLQVGDDNSTSDKKIEEKLREKIQKLKERNKKLKSKSMTESQTLEKLDAIANAIKNDPEKEIKRLKEELNESNEKVEDIKTKLDLQKEMNTLFQMQQKDIMNILGIPSEEQSFSKVLIAIKDFQETLSGAQIGFFHSKKKDQEREEEETYEKATEILENL